MNRRDFLLHGTGALAGALSFNRLLDAQAKARLPADYTIRMAPIRLEIAPGRIVKTNAFNGKVPGELIRVAEGKRLTIDVVNETGSPNLVHWHGLEIPAEEDGAEEEGSPVCAAHGGVQRYTYTARPAGFRWYHSHAYAGHDLNRATFTGEFGFLIIDPAANPARYDQEIFLALHDWDGYIESSADGYQEVRYKHATINDRMLGSGEPIRVREGQRVLLHLLNASATLTHTLALANHRFLVTALDGNPTPLPGLVETVRLGPAERVDAVVEMKQPGVWILGETDPDIRRSGMGIVIEYANRNDAPRWLDPARMDFAYEIFGKAAGTDAQDEEEVVVPLVFKPKFEGYGDFDHWTINGLSWPKTTEVPLKEGTRYRLVLDNQSNDIHPVHLHRHRFELKNLNLTPTAGILKDVVLLSTRAKTEVVFTANNPGKTLFHCHQQDHMDSGFMMLFDYK